jgi:hypothetical protein
VCHPPGPNFPIVLGLEDKVLLRSNRLIDCEQDVFVGQGPPRPIDFRPPECPGAALSDFSLPDVTWKEQMPKGMLLKSDGFASSPSDPALSFHLGRTAPSKKSPTTISEFWLLWINFSPTGCHFRNGLYLSWRDDKSWRSPASQAFFAFDWKAMESFARRLCFR